METKTTYTIKVTKTEHTPYEELNTFYKEKGEDNTMYTYQNDTKTRIKHTKPTGKVKYDETTSSVFEQTVDTLVLEDVIKAVNGLK